MDRAVVKKDDVVTFQSRREHLFDEENHRLTVNRAGDTQPCAQACQADGANRREVALVIAGHLFKNSLARRGACVPPRHPQVGAHLVDENELVEIELVSQAPELPPLLFVAFPGEKALFLRGKPSSCKTRLIVARLTDT